MDWPRARTILIAAFTVVNLVLAYVIWGPVRSFFGQSDPPQKQMAEQVRATLLEQGLVLPATVTIPETPEPMRFLHVEYRPTPDLQAEAGEPMDEVSPGGNQQGWLAAMRPVVDAETKALVYHPRATGIAAQELSLGNRGEVQQLVETFLRETQILPEDAKLNGIYPRADTQGLTVEYVSMFEGYPVFSGYVRTEVSTRGIEAVTQLWVEPTGYTDAPPKAVRPAGEALLRLAGRLTGNKRRTVIELQLGYYASRTFTMTQPDKVNGWDTVPVWRIRLDSGDVYYINAFNGEWES